MRTRTKGKYCCAIVLGAEQKMREQKKLVAGVRETHFCSFLYEKKEQCTGIANELLLNGHLK